MKEVVTEITLPHCCATCGKPLYTPLNINYKHWKGKYFCMGCKI